MVHDGDGRARPPKPPPRIVQKQPGALTGHAPPVPSSPPAPPSKPPVSRAPTSKAPGPRPAPPPVPAAKAEGTVPAEHVSVPNLLTLTDDGWDVDRHARTLKQAAPGRTLTIPGMTAVDSALARAPTLRVPAPAEIAPPGSLPAPPPPSAAGQLATLTDLPATPPPPASKPPPLPGRPGAAPSKAGPSGPPSTTKAPPSGRPPPPASRSPGSKPAPPSKAAAPVAAQAAGLSTLVDLLLARSAALEGGDDAVGRARVHLELALAARVVQGDDTKAQGYAETALRLEPTLVAAHSLLRETRHGRPQLATLLGHLEHELASAPTDRAAVELLTEKARLLDALGDRPDGVRSAWERALARLPHHPAALKGLEAALVERTLDEVTGSQEALATHLGSMAEAYVSEPHLAAWLHLERAQILEHRLGRVDAARGAYERALELDPRVGPVRDAVVRHVVAHDDALAVVMLLDHEADLESTASRAARLELEAATLAHLRLNDGSRAVVLLERAAARGPTTDVVDRHVLDKLVELHEQAGDLARAQVARRARLRFVKEPSALAHEHRVLSSYAERLGDLDTAIADVQRALGVDAGDGTLVELLDRLLAAAERPDARMAFWITEAARIEDGLKRARALGRAAAIAEQDLGRASEAVRHLRAAWVAAPGDPEVLDGLSRLLSPLPSGDLDADMRGLLDLYTQAAEHGRDPARRVAYLEKVALLAEEVLADPRQAAKAYQEILGLEPDRRGAILGLGRCAARMGDDRLHARALLEEARLAEDDRAVLDLRTRAAAALARVDGPRALSLVAEVLAMEPAHTAARALETRLHQDAGRWQLAADSLRARISLATSKGEVVSLWLALAELQEGRLRSRDDALASLRAAHTADPGHPLPPEAIARLLGAAGDFVGLRAALESLSSQGRTPEERAHFLLLAAEIDEHRLGDHGRAARTYALALAETPGCDLLADRLARVLVRGTRSGARDEAHGSLVDLAARRLERATHPTTKGPLAFQLAALLLEQGRDVARAVKLLEGLVEGLTSPDAALPEGSDVEVNLPALRLLEGVARRQRDTPRLARILSVEGHAFRDGRARLGALWNLAWLEEWRVPGAEPLGTYQRILALDSTDTSALEALLRRELPAVRKGDGRAQAATLQALRSLLSLAPEDALRLPRSLVLALRLEQASGDAFASSPDSLGREAIGRYRDALRIDALSVTAATGLARLASRWGDAEAAVAAAHALADLTSDPRVRARYFLDAADLLLTAPPDERLGALPERRARAAQLLERGLDLDPESVPVAGRLASLLLEEREVPRLLESLRSALRRAKTAEAIVMLGSEVARVGRDELNDLTVAIEAMRRVRQVAPGHVPSLLFLAELCIAQRAWPEAVESLEQVVATSREVEPRLTALFALASVYEKVLARPEDAEAALRQALTVDPQSARAIRALLRFLSTPQAPSAADAGAPPRRVDPAEIAELLTRLCDVEQDPGTRSPLLLELADLRNNLGDPGTAERCLVEAVALDPHSDEAFGRLTALFRARGGPDAVASYARALAAVIARGQQLGHLHAPWHATLGQVEADALGRVREGLVHLQRAIQLDPALHETRFHLAKALLRMNAFEESAKVMLGMIAPNARALLSLSDPGVGLDVLEQALSSDRRGEEALVVSELRAIAGNLDEGRHAWLRARRLGPFDAHHAPLDRATLVTHVLPPEGRHVLLEVAAALAGLEAKMLRSDLTELGISSRDRVSSRSGHPTRALLDRAAKALGAADLELVLSAAVNRTRVLAQDVPWVVVPKGLEEAPEPSQLASIARAVARVALGVPWLEELPPPHIEAFLIAAARQVIPNYGEEHVDVISSKLVAQYEAGVQKHIARRQRRLLDELGPHLMTAQGAPLPAEVFVDALARAELRVAYLLTGDLLASIDELRALDPHLMRATDSPGPGALAAVLDHPYAGDLVRFALTPEATALRRRVGATWTS